MISTLGFKVSYQTMLLLLMSLIHSQSIQNNKYKYTQSIFKSCLKKVRNGVHFLQAHKHQRFCNFPLLFLMEVAIHVQSTQNMMLVIFLQYIKKTIVATTLCSIECKVFRYFTEAPVMFIVTC